MESRDVGGKLEVNQLFPAPGCRCTEASRKQVEVSQDGSGVAGAPPRATRGGGASPGSGNTSACCSFLRGEQSLGTEGLRPVGRPCPARGQSSSDSFGPWVFKRRAVEASPRTVHPWDWGSGPGSWQLSPEVLGAARRLQGACSYTPVMKGWALSSREAHPSPQWCTETC